ncbi:MAG: leucine-rich repeat protein [Lachnospiraceae bacterium]|nr:leucine-rich repeat protein [Lachnospiraceae bacterium]
MNKIKRWIVMALVCALFITENNVLILRADEPLSITFEANDGTETKKTETVTDPTAFTLPACSFTAPENKEFDKWEVWETTEASPSGEKIGNAEAGKPYEGTVTGNLTFKALWKDKAESSETPGETPTPAPSEGEKDPAPEGTEPTTPDPDKKSGETGTPEPEKTGEGTADPEKTEKSGDEAEKNKDGTAEPTDPAANGQYTITFEANGGTGSMEKKTVASGEKYKLPDNGFLPPTGKKFAGWMIGSVTTQPGAEITVSSDMTVKASWEEKNTWTVSFDPAGGTGSMASEEVAKGATYKLPQNGFTEPKDKVFKCWKVSGIETNPGNTITVEADTKVTAVWEAKQTEFIVKFAANGGEGTMVNETVKAGEKYTLPACTFTAPEGKEFDKWDKGAVGEAVEIKENTTVTAIWKEIIVKDSSFIKWDTSEGKAVAYFTLPYGKDSKAASQNKQNYENYYIQLQSNKKGNYSVVYKKQLKDPELAKFITRSEFDTTVVKPFVYKIDLSRIVAENGSGGFIFNVLTNESKLVTYAKGTAGETNSSDALTVPANSLATPEKASLKWNIKAGADGYDGIAEWGAVPSAAGYIVQLYKKEGEKEVLKNTVMVDGGNTTEATVLDKNSGLTGNQIQGYYFKVMARSADITQMAYSLFSEASEELSQKLATPVPVWSGKVIKWNKDERAASYGVKLRENGVVKIDDQTVEGQYDFTEFLNKAAKDSKRRSNTFTVEVIAVAGTSSGFANSDAGVSEAYSAEKQIEDLVWDMKSGAVRFKVNDLGGEYTVVGTVKYKSGGQTVTKDVFKLNLVNMANKVDAEGFYSYDDARQYLTRDGSYSVKVTEYYTKASWSAGPYSYLFSNRNLDKPVIVNNGEIKTVIFWAAIDNAKEYEIKLYNDSKSVTMYTEDISYNLENDIARTGFKKVKVRAIPIDFEKYSESPWSNEITISANSISKVNLEGDLTDANGQATGVHYALTGTKGNFKLTLSGAGRIPSFNEPLKSNLSNLAPWADFASQIKTISFAEGSGITEIGDNAFYGCSAITSITLPGSLTKIGNYAFYNCKALKGTLTLPVYVNTIGDGAFQTDTNLTQIVFTGDEPTSIAPLTTTTNTSTTTNRHPSFNKKVKIFYFSNTNGWKDHIVKNQWYGYKITPKAVKLEKIALACDGAETSSLVLDLTDYALTSKTFDVIVYPEGAQNTKIAWKSSNKKICAVDANGKITPKKEGRVVITATAKDNTKLKATCVIVVRKAKVIKDPKTGETSGQEKAYKSGWFKTGNNYYYIRETTVNGASTTELCTGWQQVPLYTKNNDPTAEVCWQYFDKKTGYRKTGWIKDELGRKFYCNKKGKLLVSPVKDGLLTLSDLTKIGNNYYFFENDASLGSPEFGYGSMRAKDWDDNCEYYFNKNGQAVNGWNTINGKRFYFKKYKALTGFRQIDGNWYYFYQPQDINMTGNAGMSVGEMAKLTWLYGDKNTGLASGKTEYLSDDNLKNTSGIAKDIFYVNKKGVLQGGFTKHKLANGQSAYLYFNDSNKKDGGFGVMRRNFQVNKNWYANESGIKTKGTVPVTKTAATN